MSVPLDLSSMTATSSEVVLINTLHEIIWLLFQLILRRMIEYIITILYLGT